VVLGGAGAVEGVGGEIVGGAEGGVGWGVVERLEMSAEPQAFRSCSKKEKKRAN
jgi:hypothetical protein